MATTHCGTCSKIVLFMVNLVFWITGIALLGVGIWVSIDRTTVEFLQLFDDPLFRAVGFAAIAIGGLVTILGFLGCFGACHESHWMLWTYFVVVLILFLAEVVCLALTFAYQSEVEKYVTTKLDESIQENYGKEGFEGVSSAIDQLQKSLECCGNSNFTNWDTSRWYKDPSTSDKDYKKAENQVLPCSCCIEDLTSSVLCPIFSAETEKCQTPFTETAPENTRYENGCYDALYMKIIENIWIIGGIGIGVAILQVLLMILSVILLRNIEDDYE
ncbi:CD151 antigen-like [Amphiura filiformis]|uniref:CD151 antigen-like n=1 Tax=Amphiura filiformis TaxID=82378 RepID=UPI003B22434F